MLTTLDWLSALKTRTSIKSDYGIAKLLELDTASISGYRSKRNFLGAKTAHKVANQLEIDPAYVYLCAQIERAKSDEERVMLERLYVTINGPQVEENIRKLIDDSTLHQA
jgi:hypothetical protein